MKAGIFTRTSGGEIRAIGPGRLEREGIWREPENPAEELWYRGLIYRAFADFGDGPLEYIYIPEDLAVPAEAVLPQALPAAPRIAPVPAPGWGAQGAELPGGRCLFGAGRGASSSQPRLTKRGICVTPMRSVSLRDCCRRVAMLSAWRCCWRWRVFGAG